MSAKVFSGTMKQQLDFSNGDSFAGDLVVVIPVYNEEQNIERVLSEWVEVLVGQDISFLILAVNDGSTDATLEKLSACADRYPGTIRVIDKQNEGHGRTIRRGYDLAVQTHAPWVFQIDSDGQCDPAHFPGMWEKRENTDCVFAIRVSRGDGKLREAISHICHLAVRILARVDPKDANVPYRLMRREVLTRALARIPLDFDIHNVALTLVLKRMSSLRWEYVDIHFRQRQGGENSINLPRIVKMGLGMLRDLRKLK